MNDSEPNNPLSASNNKPKKRIRKIDNTIPSSTSKTNLKPVSEEIDEETKKMLSDILQNSVNKYADSVNNQLKETREDFDNLQPIISEFLEDFMLLGHTIDGQRVVIRYTKTPADFDKLNELCRKVLIKVLQDSAN